MSELRRAVAPVLTTMPCSSRKARICLIAAVRRDTRRNLSWTCAPKVDVKRVF